MERRHGEFMVYVNSIEDGIPEGYFLNLYEWKTYIFKGWGSLILQIDQLLSETDRIQWKEEITKSEYWKAGVVPEGKRFCFIQVLYTEYNTWQGQIWGENLHRTTFRSVLELLHQINQNAENEQSDKVIQVC